MQGLNPAGPLGAVLTARRERLNAAFSQARREHPRLDPAAFGAFVCGPLNRIVDAAAASRPDRGAAVGEALYDVALDLFAQDLLGPETRCPAVAELWEHVLPGVAPLLADDPEGASAALSNLVCNMEREQPGAGARWLAAAPAVACACGTAPVWLDAALVLAWRCGLAHYRATALDRWRTLPAPVRRLALGAPEDECDRECVALERRLADPWWRPGTDDAAPREIRVVGRVGGFRGLDGPFVRPPEVACSDGRLLAFDRESGWSVHADCFGATLKRAGTKPPAAGGASGTAFTIDPAGQVTRGKDTRTIPEFRDSTSMASTEWTLAVTLRHSHYVHLVAVTNRGPA